MAEIINFIEHLKNLGFDTYTKEEGEQTVHIWSFNKRGHLLMVYHYSHGFSFTYYIGKEQRFFLNLSKESEIKDLATTLVELINI